MLQITNRKVSYRSRLARVLTETETQPLHGRQPSLANEALLAFSYIYFAIIYHRRNISCLLRSCYFYFHHSSTSMYCIYHMYMWDVECHVSQALTMPLTHVSTTTESAEILKISEAESCSTNTSP